ncbi:hypothetical protein PM082_023927 [Marasmius tenuissimus]|nr:hypothetical protein PM082_023927 [Marasmius tenuissimus]
MQLHNVQFFDNINPVPGINFMLMNKEELATLGVTILDELFCPMVTAKLPEKCWQLFKQHVTRMKKEELKPTDIIAGISNEWNRRSGNSVPPAYAAHNAKISDEQVQQIDEAIASSASTASTEQQYDSDGNPMPTLVGVSSSENESENSYSVRSHSKEHINFTMPHRQASPETILSVDRIEEGQNVEEELTNVNIQTEEWPPHNAFIEYDPWATHLLPRDDPDQISKFMPENYNSDNKPTLNPTNRKIQWRFLENYQWDTKGITDEIRSPRPHPEIFNGVRLAPPKAPCFYDIEDTWRNDDRKKDVMANT